ncbi:FmdB family zinc ribbon protein [Legionella yabuuchiae]|uniref:FmdB family zinc ribbon protein n=1 Tax=Legionella yabuuchiae TaxID=376727 RepID=UPI001056A48A|nr:zinc ribbon domain-containing protein [Legionella yabuuchiae]
MPIYEYECSNCHHLFDLMQKISDVPEKQCPKCLMNTAERLVSAAGFQLKGTGWYVTDFKNKGQPKSSDASKSSESGVSEKQASSSANSSTKTQGEKD